LTPLLAPDPVKHPERSGIKARPQFVKRPGVGKNGSPIELVANHFKLIMKDVSVYHYDIQMTLVRGQRPEGAETAAIAARGASGGGGDSAGSSRPSSAPESANKLRKLRQKENRLIFNEFVKQNTGSLFPTTNSAVYDGKANFYTSKRLPVDTTRTTLTLKMEGRDNTVDIAIKWAQNIDLSGISLYYDGKASAVPREALQALDIILRYGHKKIII